MSQHVHGRPDNAYQDDDGFDLPHLDDPRINDLDLPDVMVTAPPEWELDLGSLTDGN